MSNQTDLITNQTTSLMDNEYVFAMIAIFLGLYAKRTKPSLPNWMISLFQNNIFRVVFLCLLLMIKVDSAPHIAIAVALFFVITMHFVGEHEQNEHLENIVGKSDRRRRNL